jgi:hypothetical protein
MGSKPQPDHDNPDFTRRDGKPESICMRCFLTVRAADLKSLEKREQEHRQLCPSRPMSN